MKVAWTSKAVDDLARLHEVLALVDKGAAAHVLQSLTRVASRLPAQPRLGEKLEQYEPREVRRIFAGKYELRYEVQASQCIILRVWHTREDR